MTTQLQAARASRGWSQGRLVHELVARGAAEGVALPARDSLKSQVSRWENGHVVPEAQYRRLLRQVYGLDDVELGFDGGTGQEPATEVDTELRVRLARAASLDPATLGLLVDQTEALRLLDRVQGATSLLDQLRAHVRHLETLRQHSTKPDMRLALSAALSDASSLAGWQALDMGALDQAWQHFERAKDSGREAESVALSAFALAEQAFVLLDLGEIASAGSQLDFAIKHCGTAAPTRLRSWLYATRAEMAAAAGEFVSCNRDLDRAVHLLPEGAEDGETPYLLLDAVQLERWRGHCLALCGAPEALEVLQRSLRIRDLTVRAEAGVRADMVTALCRAGDRTSLRREAEAARRAAERAGSVRQRLRLDGLLAG